MRRFLALISIVVLLFILSGCNSNFGDRFTTYSATFTWLEIQSPSGISSLSGMSVSNLCAVVKSRSILELVIEETGAFLTFDQLYQMIDVEFDRDTKVYTVCVTVDEAQLAMDIASALAEIAPTVLENGTGNSWLEVLEPPKLTTNGPIKNLFL